MKKAVFFIAVLHAFLLTACAPSLSTKQAVQKPDFQRGMRVYQANCSVCHETGRHGAPSLDDVEEWDERSLAWPSLMQDHATHGFMGMPAKGGNPRLSNQDIADALYYMDIKIKANED